MRNKMTKHTHELTFDGVLSTLGNERFDVAPASGGAKGVSGARRVSKYGCAAELAPGPGKDMPIRVMAKAGWILNGEISRLVDHGYQKFLETSKLRIPATAEHLRCIHKFDQELREATGAMSLYNESMGTTSDVYNYDRLKGRETV
ncbi:MAG TPA: hypothetical protein VKV02_09405 [Acidobacteriaceae bacterium]|nr:hypothetical protein [Acidobacteriaceae bacterium]